MSWLEQRVGLGAAASILNRRFSSSSLFGIAAISLFLVQCVVGTLLALYYTPTMDGAHASVEAINGSAAWGWLVRSLHVWGAHLLLIATLLHIVAQFFRGRYCAPREAVWLVGVAVLLATLGSAFTGQFLPMDQEAWQGGLIAASQAGPAAPMLLGGDRPFDPMLMRFFIGHVLVLPVLTLVGLALRSALAARHAEAAPAARFSFLQRVALISTAATVLLAILAFAFPPGVGPKADPTVSVAGVKPQWVFLPLYMAMRTAWLDKILLAVPLFLVALPFIDRGTSRKPILAIGAIIIAGVIALGILGWRA